MKKIIFLTTIILILLSACVDNSKWNKTDPNMPQELKEKDQKILEENLNILEKDPKNIDALFEVGYMSHMLGDYKEAEKYYKEVLAIDSVHFPALNNISSIYEEVEEYDLAAKYIKILFENNQTNSEVINDTVRILLKDGDPGNAATALETFAREIEHPGDYQQFISDLYTQIYNYNQAHEKK